VRTLLDLVLPPRCPGCAQEGTLLCAACRHVLARRLDEPAGAPLGLAVMVPSELVQLEWCAAFSGPARAALHALKYDGEQRLAEPLGQLLAERWLRVGIGGDVLVPVPIHGARLESAASTRLHSWRWRLGAALACRWCTRLSGSSGRWPSTHSAAEPGRPTWAVRSAAR